MSDTTAARLQAEKALIEEWRNAHFSCEQHRSRFVETCRDCERAHDIGVARSMCASELDTLVRSLEAETPPASPPLCACGHPSVTHRWGTGTCWAATGSGPYPGSQPCTCTVFVPIGPDVAAVPPPSGATTDEVQIEAERIVAKVFRDLDLDPNDGDVDSADAADHIVAAAQAKLRRALEDGPHDRFLLQEALDERNLSNQTLKSILDALGLKGALRLPNIITHIEQLQARALPAPPDLPKPDWQPIETAPKDGTDIVVFDPEYGVGQALWVDHLRSFQFRGWAGQLKPTLWQPLPSPPPSQGTTT